jgi:uncharacterized membrane protein
MRFLIRLLALFALFALLALLAFCQAHFWPIFEPCPTASNVAASVAASIAAAAIILSRQSRFGQWACQHFYRLFSCHAIVLRYVTPPMPFGLVDARK